MLILASESPRRRVLLKRILDDFSVESVPVEELKEGDDLRELPRLNAILKAKAESLRRPEAFVLGADTGVFAGCRMLGKPRDPDDARAMLHLLSGKSHEVITGCALCCGGNNTLISWSVTTKVHFAPLDDAMITAYFAAVPVLDKAGAYGIQEHPELLGASYEGELENVIGLPLVRLKQELHNLGIAG